MVLLPFCRRTASRPRAGCRPRSGTSRPDIDQRALASLGIDGEELAARAVDDDQRAAVLGRVDAVEVEAADDLGCGTGQRDGLGRAHLTVPRHGHAVDLRRPAVGEVRGVARDDDVVDERRRSRERQGDDRIAGLQVVHGSLAGGCARHPQEVVPRSAFRPVAAGTRGVDDEHLAGTGAQVAARDATVGDGSGIELVVHADGHAFAGEPCRQIDGVRMPILTVVSAVRSAVAVEAGYHDDATIPTRARRLNMGPPGFGRSRKVPVIRRGQTALRS